MRYLLYAISLFLPFAGIVIKVIAGRIDDEGKRRVGEVCLLLSAVPTALFVLVAGFHVLMRALSFSPR